MIINLVQGSELLDKFREVVEIIDILDHRVAIEEDFITNLCDFAEQITTEEGMFVPQGCEWIEAETGEIVSFWDRIAPDIRDYLV